MGIKTGLFMYKSNKNLPQKNLLVYKYGQVHTRQTGNFKQFDLRTTQKQTCITNGGSKLWNSLETNLKEKYVYTSEKI